MKSKKQTINSKTDSNPPLRGLGGRRHFLKVLGTTAAVSGMALVGCDPKNGKAVGGKGSGIVSGEMTYRVNPHTGDKVSLLGYGCMRWPLRQRADGNGEEIDQDAVNDLVDYAIAHGVNYFDTSPVYVRGWSEKATGIALSRHPRESYFIATKMSNFANDPQLRSFEGSSALYYKSMEDLQVDYIDYYLLHGIGMDGMDAFRGRFIDNGILDFLLKERQAGRIRNLGFSYHGDIEVYDYLLSLDIQWDFAQIQLNYIDWQNATGRNTNAEYLYGELVKRNVPAVIMEPLLGGRLGRLNPHALAILKEERPEDSAAAWAFRYAGTPEHVLTVLSGMVYMEHLQENVQTYSPLILVNQQENEALEKVTELMLRSDYIACTECQYCMPCPYGLDIPGTFAHYNRCISEENLSKSSQDPNYVKARRAFLIGYDRSVPKLRQANHCIGCDQCLAKCPQKIEIVQEMQRIDLYAERLKQRLAF
ncbi:MAG: aldo/keto reductase [Tannerellaceae bacterium]|nr:aldo/keto reductase [Tannerellaceae bacterium]